VLVAPLDAIFDESSLDWDPPSNAILEIPTTAAARPEDADRRAIVFRDGKRWP